MRGLDPSRGNPIEVWPRPKLGETIVVTEGKRMIQKRSWAWTTGYAIVLGLIIWLISKAWVIIQRF